MRARITDRGRLRVLLEDPDEEVWQREREHLMGLIGSANIVRNDVPEISCEVSVQNLRKLRQEGCKLLITDERTREGIARLHERRVLYDAQSANGNRAKAGEELFGGYEFKKPPFHHQLAGFQFLHAMPNPALFGDCGTGKTFIVSTYADSLIKAGERWAFFVVCPVNLIRWVWMDDLKKFSDLSYVSLREPTSVSILGEDLDEKGDPKWDLHTRVDIQARAALRAERRADREWRKKAVRRAQARHRKLLEARFAQDVDVYILNPENVRTDPKEKRARKLLRRKIKDGYRWCLVVDESSMLKSRTSRTYKALKRLRAFCDRCIIMTGTPSPNGVQDLWAQFSLLDGGQTLQPSFTDYRHDTCHEIVLRGVTYKDKKGNTHNAKKWSTKPGAAREVYNILQPRMIRFRTEDCVDLPPKRFLTRDVNMNAEQAEAYSDMENMLFTEIEGEPVTAKIAATKLLKLRQVTGGFLITDEHNPIPLGKNSPKMLELDTLLEQSIGAKMGHEGPPFKAIVWAQYRWECKALVKRYSKAYGARGLFGGISSGAKDRAIESFKNNPRSRLLVCHPGSVGHGLTLTEANFVFYYSLSYNYEEFYQSYRRVPRPGQTRSMTFYFLVCPGTIDEDLIEAIGQKKDLSDLITDGQFNRDDFVKRRSVERVAQLRMEWEVPGDQASSAGGQ
jgi:SNF2 family DNA or RNA helicase